MFRFSLTNMSRNVIIAYRLCLGLLGLSSLAALFFQQQRSAFEVINFFSYFTIQSNIFAILILWTSVLASFKNRESRFEKYRGAVVVFLLTTGLVYAHLLFGREPAGQVPHFYANLVVHCMMPITFLLDWFFVKSPAVSLKQALQWILFPLTFLVYSLIRGAFTSWYPYGFINPQIQGYGSVSVTVLAMTLGILLLSLIVQKVSVLRRPLWKI